MKISAYKVVRPLLALVICLFVVSPAQASLRDKIEKALQERSGGSGELDTNTIAAGITAIHLVLTAIRL